MSRYSGYNDSFQTFFDHAERQFQELNEMANRSFFTAASQQQQQQQPPRIGNHSSNNPGDQSRSNNNNPRQQVLQQQQNYDRRLSPFGSFFDDPFFNSFPAFPAFPAFPSFPSTFQQSSISSSRITPPVEIHENEKAYEMTLSIPGATKKHITIDFNKNTNELIIKGEIPNGVTETTKNNLIYSERSYGSFQRSLRLPEYVDGENVQASFENGILRLTAPKIASGASNSYVRRIQISDPNSPPTATIEEIPDDPKDTSKK